MTENTGDAAASEITAEYSEADGERRLQYSRDGQTAILAQNIDGYAMVAVRQRVDAPELERYYGFDMALDHAAELLGIEPSALPVPDEAADMGM